jgi:putative FmdB family regulatory protein
MTYEYQCVKCDHSFDVIKSVKDMDVNEYCPHCDNPAERQFVPSRVHFTGTKVENAEYNPGLGAVTKNKAHRAELAKRKGVVEIGNDYKSPETQHSEGEKLREARREARYKKAMDEI